MPHSLKDYAWLYKQHIKASQRGSEVSRMISGAAAHRAQHAAKMLKGGASPEEAENYYRKGNKALKKEEASQVDEGMLDDYIEGKIAKHHAKKHGAEINAAHAAAADVTNRMKPITKKIAQIKKRVSYKDKTHKNYAKTRADLKGAVSALKPLDAERSKHYDTIRDARKKREAGTDSDVSTYHKWGVVGLGVKKLKQKLTKEEVEQIDEMKMSVGTIVKLKKPIDGHGYARVKGFTSSSHTRGPTGRGVPMPAGKVTKVHVALKKTKHDAYDPGPNAHITHDDIHSVVMQEDATSAMSDKLKKKNINAKDMNTLGKLHALMSKEKAKRKPVSESYDKAEEHKAKASKALETSDMEAYHQHMSNHHEELGKWHESKGRGSLAQREYDKAEKHHEESLNPDKSKTLKGSWKMSNEGILSKLLGKKHAPVKKPAVKKTEYQGLPAEWSQEKRGNEYDANKHMAKMKKEETTMPKTLKDIRANLQAEAKDYAPVAPVPGDKWKSHAVMVHPETKQRVVVARKNAGNYPESEGWKEVGPGMKLKAKVKEGYMKASLPDTEDDNGQSDMAEYERHMKSQKKGVRAYDKKGNLVGNYRSKEDAQKFKPGHTYKEEVEQVDEGAELENAKKVAAMPKGSILGSKDDIKAHLAYLKARHAHLKKFGYSTKQVADKIGRVNHLLTQKEEVNLDEMDSEGYRGTSDPHYSSFAGKKWIEAEVITPKQAAKGAAKIFKNILKKQAKRVKEEAKPSSVHALNPGMKEKLWAKYMADKKATSQAPADRAARMKAAIAAKKGK